VGIGTEDDAAHAVWSEEPVLDALVEGVGVDRIAEVAIGVDIRIPLWGRSHPELGCGGEVLEDFPPARLVVSAATMALVHYDQVEVVRRVILESVRTVPTTECLVRGEEDTPGGIGLSENPMHRISEDRCERLAHWLVDQRMPVGEVEDPVDAGLSERLPVAPDLPHDLHRGEGLAGACGHRQQQALVTSQHRGDGPVNGDPLVVPGHFYRRIGVAQHPAERLA